MNTEPTYWHDNYPRLTGALSGLTGQDDAAVRMALAYIAGDYAHMPDDEVIASWLGENTAEVIL